MVLSRVYHGLQARINQLEQHILQQDAEHQQLTADKSSKEARVVALEGENTRLEAEATQLRLNQGSHIRVAHLEAEVARLDAECQELRSRPTREASAAVKVRLAPLRLCRSLAATSCGSFLGCARAASCRCQRWSTRACSCGAAAECWAMGLMTYTFCSF